MFDLLGLKEFLDGNDWVRLASRLALDLVFAWFVIRRIHFRRYRNHDLAFTYLLFNVITFSVCFLLRKVPIELGFALGLFAVFGILRYRTEPIRTRDLTYLFVVIGIAILNAVANKKVSFVELVTLDIVIVGLTWAMSTGPFGGGEETHLVVYDNLALLGPGRRAELLADLTGRTGLDVVSVDVDSLNLLNDTAKLNIRCRRNDSADEGSGT